MQYLRGQPEPPGWTQQAIFNKRHRAFLVMLGWFRYLRNRGADRDWVQDKLGIEDLTDLTKCCKSPEELLAGLKRIDSELTGPKIHRAYSDFKELPAAHALYPT